MIKAILEAADKALAVDVKQRLTPRENAERVARFICNSYDCDLGVWEFDESTETLTIFSMTTRAAIEKIHIELTIGGKPVVP